MIISVIFTAEVKMLEYLFLQLQKLRLLKDFFNNCFVFKT